VNRELTDAVLDFVILLREVITVVQNESAVEDIDHRTDGKVAVLIVVGVVCTCLQTCGYGLVCN